MKNDPKILFKEITKKEVRSCERIPFGLTNDNYLINNAYVLRVPRDNIDSTINYPNEKEAYSLIDPLKMNEKVVFFDPLSGIKISKFIHNTHLYNEISNEEIFFVAKMLKKLHNAKINAPFGYQMFNRLDIYKKEVPEKYWINDSYEKRVIKETMKIFSKDPLTFCHNDLVKGNLLFRFNAVYFIDWEMAAMNNPLFDLASFISENNLTPEQKETFLKKYFGYKYNNIKKKRVDIFMNFQDILFYYWAMNYFLKRKDKIYLDIAKEKLARIKNYAPSF